MTQTEKETRVGGGHDPELERRCNASVAGSTCPGCRRGKKRGHGLCCHCFYKLPKPLRAAMGRTRHFAQSWQAALNTLK